VYSLFAFTPPGSRSTKLESYCLSIQTRMAPITFYHFTRKTYALTVVNEGIRRGDVPITPTTGLNAVWLFSTPDPRYFTVLNSTDTTDAKRGVRITLKLDSQDPNLKRWTQVAHEYKVDPEHYRRQNVGEKHGSDGTWWLYRGKIGRDKFISIGIKKDGIRSLDYKEYNDVNAAVMSLMTNEQKERTAPAHMKLVMQSMLMQGYPEPETGWPTGKKVDRSCSNPACATTTKKLLECAACHIVQYCSKRCQRSHWKVGHKIKCKAACETRSDMQAGRNHVPKSYLVHKDMIL
jgi:hypothetical protein